MSIIIYGESYPEISRHYYPPTPTSGTREALMEQPQAIGTREALMELREAPYPYSKMCNVCNVCNVLTCMSNIPKIPNNNFYFSILFAIFS